MICADNWGQFNLIWPVFCVCPKSQKLTHNLAQFSLFTIHVKISSKNSTVSYLYSSVMGSADSDIVNRPHNVQLNQIGCPEVRKNHM